MCVIFKAREVLALQLLFRRLSVVLYLLHIMDQLASNIRWEFQYRDVVCVGAPTGSGKSTDLLELLLRDYPNIACANPKTECAKSLASWMATKSRSDLGEAIGVMTEDGCLTSANTKLVYLTYGILLSMREAMADFDVIVLDEIHEREHFKVSKLEIKGLGTWGLRTNFRKKDGRCLVFCGECCRFGQSSAPTFQTVPPFTLLHP